MSSSSSSRNAEPKTFKIMLVGSAVAKRAINEFFRPSHEHMSTLGVDFILRTINDNRFQIWDLAGQERFKTMTAQYYRNAHTLVLCPTSLQDLIELHQKVSEVIDRDLQNVGVATNDAVLQDWCQAHELLAVNLPTAENPDDFLQAIANRDAKQNRPVWRTDNVYAYYHSVQAALKSDLPADLSDLIFDYAVPAAIAISQEEKAAERAERVFIALIQESAQSKDPILQLRISLHYQHLNEPELAEVHFNLANDYVLDKDNNEIVNISDTLLAMKSLLKNTPNEAFNVALLEQHFAIRRQSLYPFQALGPASSAGFFNARAAHSELWANELSPDQIRDLNQLAVAGRPHNPNG